VQFGFFGREARFRSGQPNFSEHLMIIELNDDDTRLCIRSFSNRRTKRLSYADTSEVAERSYKLATRFERPVRELPI